jgi:hypothetical protein
MAERNLHHLTGRDHEEILWMLEQMVRVLAREP